MLESVVEVSLVFGDGCYRSLSHDARMVEASANIDTDSYWEAIFRQKDVSVVLVRRYSWSIQETSPENLEGVIVPSRAQASLRCPNCTRHSFPGEEQLFL